MRYFITLFPLIFLFAADPTFAKDFRTSLEADLTGDGLIDFVELYESAEPGNADMNIWVLNKDGVLDLSSQSMSIVWVGGPGQQPELSLSDHGSLMIHSMNESIGRDRWHQTLTVAWRGNVFVLAGFTYDWYDTLVPEKSGTCDVNLLSGEGVRTKGTFLREISFRTKSRSGPIEKWDGEPPTECFPNN